MRGPEITPVPELDPVGFGLGLELGWNWNEVGVGFGFLFGPLGMGFALTADDGDDTSGGGRAPNATLVDGER